MRQLTTSLRWSNAACIAASAAGSIGALMIDVVVVRHTTCRTQSVVKEGRRGSQVDSDSDSDWFSTMVFPKNRSRQHASGSRDEP